MTCKHKHTTLCLGKNEYAKRMCYDCGQEIPLNYGGYDMDKNPMIAPEKMMNTYGSLLKAVQESGGGLDWLSFPTIKTVSAIDLITVLARNNIVFKYEKE